MCVRLTSLSLLLYCVVGASLPGCLGGRSDNCDRGAEGCACYPNGTCDDGLMCLSKLCVDPDSTSDSDDTVTAADGGDTQQGDKPNAPRPAPASAGTDAATDEPTSGGASDASASDDSVGEDGPMDEPVSGTDEPEPNDPDPSEPQPNNPNPTEPGPTEPGPTEPGPTEPGPTEPGPTEPAGSGYALTAIDGWVARSSNAVGIQGDWHTFGDPLSTYAPRSEPFFAGGMICISGSLLPYGDYPEAWGAGLSLNLNVEPMQEPQAYDASAYGVRGIRFTMRGANPAHIQINWSLLGQADGTTYCQDIYDVEPERDSLFVNIDDASYNCWEASGSSPDPTRLRAFQVQVLSDYLEVVEFDFCLEDVAALPE